MDLRINYGLQNLCKNACLFAQSKPYQRKTPPNKPSATRSRKRKKNPHSTFKHLDMNISSQSEIKMANCPNSEKYPPIIKSPLDPLQYRAIKLENGLKALLISTIYGHDPPEPRKDICVRMQVDQFNAVHLGIGKVQEIGPQHTKNMMPLRRLPINENLLEGGLYHVFFTVGSGMLSDTLPGMAHFTEHLLFFGSKKYPEHEGFTKFLKRMDGDSNATTSLEFTCYEFIVSSEGIEEAMDRFCDLMLNPRWNVDLVGNERFALTCEFWNLWMDDKMRYEGVLHHLANPKHPMSNLGLGNGMSLGIRADDLANHAKDWKNYFYVSNNISMVVISPASLDEMEGQVARHFSKLPHSCHDLLSPRLELRDKYADIKSMDSERWNKSYYLVPSRQNNFILLSWSLRPGFGQNFKTKPLNVLSFILQNRSEGGLDHYLRKKGWLVFICTYCHSVDHTILNTIFMVTLFLTKEGIEHAEEVVREVFLYVQRLQASSSKELRRMFDELRLSQADSFHYRSDQHIATSHFLEELDPASINDSNSSVQLYKLFTKFLQTQDEASIPNMLVDIFVSHKWDEGLLRETMMSLLDPTIANVLVARKDLVLPEANETIPWNGIWYFPTPFNFLTEYNIYGGWSFWKALWGKRAHTWGSAASRKYSLPPENQFTRSTQCFPISKSKSPEEFTTLDNDRFLIQAFPERCRRGFLSTAKYVFQVKSDVGLESMEKGTYPQMTLLAKCFENILHASLAEALDTLITVRVNGICDKLKTEVTGPSSVLPSIFEHVVDNFGALENKITPFIYTSRIQEILSNLEVNKNVSEHFVDKMIHNLLDKHVCSKRNFVASYQDLTFDAFIRFVQKLKKEMKITVELYGCVNVGDGKRVSGLLQKLRFCPRNPATKPCGKNFRFQLPDIGKEWRFKKPGYNPIDPVHWVKNYYQIGSVYDDGETLKCVVDDMSEQVYHQLRGMKHTGYVADASFNEAHSVISLEIRVNGLAYRFNSEWLEKEIDTFLSNYYQKAILNKKYFLDNIRNKYDVTWSNAKKFFELYLLPSGRNYKKLSIHILGNAGAAPCHLRWNAPTGPLKNGSKKPIDILDPVKFKSELKKSFPNHKKDDDNSDDED